MHKLIYKFDYIYLKSLYPVNIDAAGPFNRLLETATILWQLRTSTHRLNRPQRSQRPPELRSLC